MPELSYIAGLNTDKVYESFIRQITGDSLPRVDGQSLQACIEVQRQNERLMRKIARLEKLARADRQPKKKFEMVQQKNALMAVLEEVYNGRI